MSYAASSQATPRFVSGGTTAEELATMAGIGKPCISQIETGNREGSVKVYAALAKALQVDVDDLSD